MGFDGYDCACKQAAAAASTRASTMREFVFMQAKYTSLGALGAEIRGIDISQPLSKEAVADLLDAWHEHLVLVFRDQKMNDAALVAFSRNFGALEKAPIPEKLRGGFSHVPLLPEVAVGSHGIENGAAVGAPRAGALVWDNDKTNPPQPPPPTGLRAPEV